MRNLFSYFLIFNLFAQNLYSDSFNYNTFNNHGVLGLINMPSARLYDEASYGISLYNGDPDQKITMTSFPFNWMEASFFYSNIKDKPYCSNVLDPICKQDYKDKGFNFKIRIKEEGYLPAIAIGINDIAGTGLYSSEYIVGSYGINNTDIHFGLGWGNLNGSKKTFKNPLVYIYDGFNSRPIPEDLTGGQFQLNRYFSDKRVSPLFGISHAFNEKLLFKIEHDTNLIPGKVGFKEAKKNYSFGFDYSFNQNFTIGISNERGNYTSVRFVYKNNAIKQKKIYKYKSASVNEDDNKYTKLIKNIEANNIGVNKIIETSDAIGLELTQFTHPNLEIIESIIKSATFDSGINKKIKTDIRSANLKAIQEYDSDFENRSLVIYKKPSKDKFSSNTNFSFRPYLASRESFFKGSLLIENNSEYIIKENFFFSSNIKYSIYDNFDDLRIPPENTYPAQVRSDVKEYLRNFNKGIFIGRAQFDYHLTPKKNHHLMFTVGILEEMFNGAGMEYLYFKEDSNYAFGFEVFDVRKRDYEMRFGTLDYKNLTGSVNFYYRNFDFIPFDSKISFGEYLAGDEGITFELSRSFLNGTKFGVFATFTDVSSEQFGEGSFDKGLFFNIPVYGNIVNYSWRPLTKDPGAKLIRKHTLYDLLVKFRPYNY